jgi:hypothetical protein
VPPAIASICRLSTANLSTLYLQTLRLLTENFKSNSSVLQRQLTVSGSSRSNFFLVPNMSPKAGLTNPLISVDAKCRLHLNATEDHS